MSIYLSIYIYIYIYIVYKNGKQILSKRQRKTPKKAQERCQNLSGKEKEKRQKMVKDRYKNLPEEKKNKNFVSVWKNTI